MQNEMKPIAGRWNYSTLNEQRVYGDIRSYQLAMEHLNPCSEVEDWGCGCGVAKRFCTTKYIGVDGSPSKWSDKVADLTTYRSSCDGILLRHVLEHNPYWKDILRNAISSFRSRLVIVSFLPLKEKTVVKDLSHADPFVDGTVPNIHLSRPEIQAIISPFITREESISDSETLFYVTRP